MGSTVYDCIRWDSIHNYIWLDPHHDDILSDPVHRLQLIRNHTTIAVDQIQSKAASDRIQAHDYIGSDPIHIHIVGFHSVFSKHIG